MKNFVVICLTLFVAMATMRIAVAVAEDLEDPDEIIFDLNETDDDVEYEYEVPPTETAMPSVSPSEKPTSEPTGTPTTEPTATPTSAPSLSPTFEPSAPPTDNTTVPSSSPSVAPTGGPTTICESTEVGTKSERKAACMEVTVCAWVPQARNKKGACLLVTSCSDINDIPAPNQAKKQQCEKSPYGCSFKKGVCSESSAPTPAPSQAPTAPTTAPPQLTCEEANELKLKRRRKEVCMANEKCVYSGKADRNKGLCVEVNNCSDVNEFQLNGGIRETRCRFVNRERMPCEFIDDLCQELAAN